MIVYDEKRRLAEYEQSTVDELPDISPLKYQPELTSNGQKANFADSSQPRKEMADLFPRNYVKNKVPFGSKQNRFDQTFSSSVVYIFNQRDMPKQNEVQSIKQEIIQNMKLQKGLPGVRNQERSHTMEMPKPLIDIQNKDFDFGNMQVSPMQAKEDPKHQLYSDSSKSTLKLQPKQQLLKTKSQASIPYEAKEQKVLGPGSYDTPTTLITWKKQPVYMFATAASSNRPQQAKNRSPLDNFNLTTQASVNQEQYQSSPGLKHVPAIMMRDQSQDQLAQYNEFRHKRAQEKLRVNEGRRVVKKVLIQPNIVLNPQNQSHSSLERAETNLRFSPKNQGVSSVFASKSKRSIFRNSEGEQPGPAYYNRQKFPELTRIQSQLEVAQKKNKNLLEVQNPYREKQIQITPGPGDYNPNNPQLQKAKSMSLNEMKAHSFGSAKRNFVQSEVQKFDVQEDRENKLKEDIRKHILHQESKKQLKQLRSLSIEKKSPDRKKYIHSKNGSEVESPSLQVRNEVLMQQIGETLNKPSQAESEVDQSRATFNMELLKTPAEDQKASKRKVMSKRKASLADLVKAASQRLNYERLANQKSKPVEPGPGHYEVQQQLGHSSKFSHAQRVSFMAQAEKTSNAQVGPTDYQTSANENMQKMSHNVRQV